ncbi:MAG: hypothetical protein FJY85_02170 [Deltaproteobacteria bacterium]|nr:hypothetical protein [Deltaproteobacteria bacterium]
MFLDKVWLRIRGELLTLREDLSAGDDLRERARSLLRRLEAALGGVGQESEAEESQSLSQHPEESRRDIGPSNIESLREIEREWEDLRERRDQAREPDGNMGPSSPNPRRLG